MLAHTHSCGDRKSLTFAELANCIREQRSGAAGDLVRSADGETDVVQPYHLARKYVVGLFREHFEELCIFPHVSDPPAHLRRPSASAHERTRTAHGYAIQMHSRAQFVVARQQ